MERNDDNNEVIRNARKKAKDNKENFTKDKEENKELDNSEEINLNLNNEENVSNQEDLECKINNNHKKKTYCIAIICFFVLITIIYFSTKNMTT